MRKYWRVGLTAALACGLALGSAYAQEADTGGTGSVGGATGGSTGGGAVGGSSDGGTIGGSGATSGTESGGTAGGLTSQSEQSETVGDIGGEPGASAARGSGGVAGEGSTQAEGQDGHREGVIGRVNQGFEEPNPGIGFWQAFFIGAVMVLFALVIVWWVRGMSGVPPPGERRPTA